MKTSYLNYTTAVFLVLRLFIHLYTKLLLFNRSKLLLSFRVSGRNKSCQGWLASVGRVACRG